MKETRRQRIERRIKEAYAKGRRDELRKCMRSCEVCDAKIINKFAEELKSRLGDAIYPKDFVSMRNLIDDVAKEQKNEK